MPLLLALWKESLSFPLPPSPPPPASEPAFWMSAATEPPLPLLLLLLLVPPPSPPLLAAAAAVVVAADLAEFGEVCDPRSPNENADNACAIGDTDVDAAESGALPLAAAVAAASTVPLLLLPPRGVLPLL